MATTTILNDLIDLNQTGNTTALKGCVGTNAQQPIDPTINVQYLVVGGGGAANGSGSGGGGAGGLSTGTIAIPNNTAVNIVVGQGAAAPTTWDGIIYNGEDSGFYTIQGQGGGSATERADGNPGGSGGGGGHLPNSGTIYDGGSSVVNQGNNGGDATSAGNWNTGGGGGAGSVGADGTASQSGNGGSGKDAVGSPISIITQANGTTANVGEVNGAELNFAGGGGGGGNDTNNILPGNGGSGGGGNGSNTTSVNGFNGTPNTGGGGGGGNGDSATPGGAGGSGVVILRYANTATETISGSLAGGITTGTTTDCNYPTTSNGLALYQFSLDATDTCGNYDGTNDSGITYSSPGVFGNGAQFGGGSDRIDINQAILGSGTTKIWSTSFWFLTSSTGEQYLNNSAAASGFTGFGILTSPTNGYLRFQTSNGSGSFSPYLSLEDRSVQDGNWHHVVATYSSAGGTNDAYMYLYLDGQNVTDLCTAGGSWTQGGGATWSSFTIPRISLGNWADSSTYPGGLFSLIGSMDQVRFFDVALTADQVAMLYAENIGATKFTESSDTVLVFKAGSGTINLTDTSLPGPKVGDLRTNTDQSSAGSASAMEHYTSTGWRVFDNYSTLGICNYPITAAALYQFEDTPNATCGPNPTTTTNLTYVTGKFSKAVDFNGTDSVWQTTSQIINSQSNFSISMWVKVDAYASSSYLWTSYITGDWSLNMGGTGDAYFRLAKWNNTQPGTYIEVANPSASTLGQWYHVCGTFSTTTGMVLYIDGTSVGSDTTTWAGKLQAGSNKDSIGCYGLTAGGDRANFNGQIDQFRAFQSTLTAAQVTELYNEQ